MKFKESLMWTNFTYLKPTILSKIARILSGLETSMPESFKWHVSKQTPILFFLTIKSIIVLISIKFAPISLPFPAIVSRQIVTFILLSFISLIASAMYLQPSNLFLLFPGWRTTKFIPIVFALFTSFDKRILAQFLFVGSSLARFIIYGQWIAKSLMLIFVFFKATLNSLTFKLPIGTR